MNSQHATKVNLACALITPILVLISMVTWHSITLYHATEITLPITGYDPRHLLSGHYLRYQVIYGPEAICTSKKRQMTQVCLWQDQESGHWYGKTVNNSDLNHTDCPLFIVGRCSRHQFYANIEKFFIPESHAVMLEQAITNKPASIKIRVTRTGQAKVSDLLIEGKSWREYIKHN